MTQNIVSESEVKKLLNIETFRNLSKDKVMEFVSLIPYMDKEVAISIINQFPNYVGTAKEMVESLRISCDSIIEKNDNSRKDSVEAYKIVLSNLASLLENENLSENQQKYITEQMVVIADKIAAKDSENKTFYTELIKYRTYFAAGMLMIGGIILGVNVNHRMINSH